MFSAWIAVLQFPPFVYCALCMLLHFLFTKEPLYTAKEIVKGSAKQPSVISVGKSLRIVMFSNIPFGPVSRKYLYIGSSAPCL